MGITEARGVGWMFLDVPADTVSPGGRAALWLLRRFAEVEGERLAERGRENGHLRKQRGRATNQYAGLGYRLVGPSKRRRRVPDRAEQEVMAAIYDWHEQGQTFERIYHTLWQNRIYTREGKEWNYARIRRAYEAEQQRRDLLHQQQGASASEEKTHDDG